MADWLNEKKIKALTWGGEAQTIRDGKIAGFFVSVNKTCKSYKIQADLWQGPSGRRTLVRTVRHTIGTTETHSLAEARNIAAELLSKIKRGVDPFPPKRQARDGADLMVVNGDPVGWNVDELMLNYQAVLAAEEKSERSIHNIEETRARYLKRWRGRMIVDIRKKDARELHAYITANHGKVVANQTMRYFRAAYNVAEALSDDKEAFEYNPVQGVIFHKERASKRVILPQLIFDWWRQVEALPNPLRQEMHKLHILSGLRPGTVMTIKREWLDLQSCTIHFPKMKTSEGFDLPLSWQMVDCVKRAEEMSKFLYPGSEWLFPTRAKDRSITHTKVIREKSMPSETGHILRHTHRTIAQSVGVSPINAKLLLDQKIPGIDSVYIHDVALFGPLLRDQQRISDCITSLATDRDAILPTHANAEQILQLSPNHKTVAR
jgi:integrase